MCLAAKVDKERLRAKQPMGVVQEFDAAAGGPSNLRVLVGLRKCAEIREARCSQRSCRRTYDRPPP